METMEIDLVGNTKRPDPKEKREIQLKNWFFTWNNYTEENVETLKLFISECVKIVVGKEIGESGTPHLQGCFVLKKKNRLTNLKKILGTKIHLEKTRSVEQAEDYCQKEENVIIRYGFPKPIDIIKTLYPWQKDIENILLGNPDPRKIYWIYEEEGNVGKSSFVKYMAVKYNILFTNGGKVKDMINLAYNANWDISNCIIWDLPRENQGKVSWSAIECIKNGMVCNTKYETGVKLFNTPHIMIFANCLPSDTNSLSSDRWDIRKIVDMTLESFSPKG